jgi:hypothetical protein
MSPRFQRAFRASLGIEDPDRTSRARNAVDMGFDALWFWLLALFLPLLQEDYYGGRSQYEQYREGHLEACKIHDDSIVEARRTGQNRLAGSNSEGTTAGYRVDRRY